MPDATRGETRQRRPRLPADPYYGRHCASSRGHRRRQKEAARGSSFPERAPLCPRDYELASISWMEHPPGPSPPLHNGGWCTHYCDIVATIRFRNRVPYIENARGRAFVVREAGGRNFRLGIIQAPPLWRISGWFIACSLGTFFLSFFLSLVERGGNARRVAFYSVAKRLRYSL